MAPGIIETVETIPNTQIKNVCGSNSVSKKGKIDLFNGAFKPLTFYVLKFHYFFDGIIGSETLATLNTQINYENETITLMKKQFSYSKFYPTKQLYNHFVTIETVNNGDWFVPTYQKLSKKTFVQPGLYHAKNGKSTISIISTSKNPMNLPKLKLKINNFETISTIISIVYHSFHSQFTP